MDNFKEHNEEFKVIHVHVSVKREFDKLLTVIGKYTDSKIYYPELTKRLKELTKNIEDEIAAMTHTHFKNVGAKPIHVKIVEAINNRFKIDEMEPETKDKIKIPLKTIKDIIMNVTGKRDHRVVNRNKEKIFQIMGLKQVQINKDWFVVTKYCEVI